MKRPMATMGFSSAALMSGVLIGGLLVSGIAVALEPANLPPLAKRQILECMTKRMSADRAISYNDAMKVCRDRVLAGKLALNANSSIEAVGKSH